MSSTKWHAESRNGISLHMRDWDTRDEAIEWLGQWRVGGVSPGDQVLVLPGGSWVEDTEAEADVDAWVQRYNDWKCPHVVEHVVMINLNDTSTGSFVMNLGTARLYCPACNCYTALVRIGTDVAPGEFTYKRFFDPVPAPPPAVRTGNV